MGRMVYFKRITWLALLVLLIIISGCTTFTTDSNMEAPPVSNILEGHSDIVLPADLKWENSESMAIKTDSFTGGIYHFTGRLDVNSLKQFIITSMASNKWKLVGEASYKNIMLAFIKPNKTCMVTIIDGFGGSMGRTHVKLYVTADLAAVKGLNPFGEPVN